MWGCARKFGTLAAGAEVVVHLSARDEVWQEPSCDQACVAWFCITDYHDRSCCKCVRLDMPCLFACAQAQEGGGRATGQGARAQDAPGLPRAGGTAFAQGGAAGGEATVQGLLGAYELLGLSYWLGCWWQSLKVGVPGGQTAWPGGVSPSESCRPGLAGLRSRPELKPSSVAHGFPSGSVHIFSAVGRRTSWLASRKAVRGGCDATSVSVLLACSTSGRSIPIITSSTES